MKEIEGISIDSLTGKYGSPVFVVSADTLRNNIRSFKNKFSTKYPKVELAYAYKANCISEILKVIHGEGAWAEAASGFEYDIARRLGVKGSRIVFNGPYKTKEQLQRAVDEGALINADNTEELELLEEIASELSSTIDIGIRVNADVGINQVIDRFGFNLESGEAMEAVRLCTDKGVLNLVCLHIHLTSYIVEPEGGEHYIPAQKIKLIWPKSSEMYKAASGKIAGFAESIRAELGINIKFLDMGGGFPSIDQLDPYIENVTEPIRAVFGDDLPVLILEPGRAIVKNAVSLITTVIGAKQFPNGQRAVTVDGGVNLLPTSHWSLQDVKTKSTPDTDLMETIVYGPLCLQTDIIAKSNLPELKRGDKIVIENVGAYDIPQSSSFIFPRPAVVMIENGEEKVIRRSETIEDIFNLD